MDGLIDSLDTMIAFGKLDPYDRETVIDHAILGLTVAEIAQRDGVSKSTVDRRYKRGSDTLARELGWTLR